MLRQLVIHNIVYIYVDTIYTNSSHFKIKYTITSRDQPFKGTGIGHILLLRLPQTCNVLMTVDMDATICDLNSHMVVLGWQFSACLPT